MRPGEHPILRRLVEAGVGVVLALGCRAAEFVEKARARWIGMRC